jgi:hypothetical protein
MASHFGPLREEEAPLGEQQRDVAAPGAQRSTLRDGELDAVDGVRGLASLFIVVGHILTYWTPNKEGAAYPQLGLEVRATRSGRRGASQCATAPAPGPRDQHMDATSMSPDDILQKGFTLTLVYGDAEVLSSRDARRAFLWKRFARLGPIYYLSLLVALPQLLVSRGPVVRASCTGCTNMSALTVN